MIDRNSTRKKEILVIDDDPVILSSIQKQLKDENYNLEMINDPNHAIDVAFNREFDVILCDIKMEPINGLEILKKIKTYRPGVPVIILTGYVDDQMRSKAKEYGSSDFLIKPVRKRQLIDAINNVRVIY